MPAAFIELAVVVPEATNRMIAVVLRLLLGIGSVGCGEHEFAGGDVERGSGGDWET